MAQQTLVCPVCGETKPMGEFFQNYNSIHQTYHRSKMFFCIKCSKTIATEIIDSYKSIKLGLRAMCTFFDLPVKEEIIHDLVEKYIDEVVNNDPNWVAIYIQELKKRGVQNVEWDNLAYNSLTDEPLWRELDDDELELFREIRDMWGERNFKEYEFLERTWQRYTDKKDLTTAEKSLYRQLCIAELDIRKKEKAGQSAANEQKMAMTLMSKLKIDKFDENKYTAEGKMIEEKIYFIEHTDPADYFEDKTKFKDIQGIEEYVDNTIRRPFRNLLLNQKDYKIIEQLVEVKSGKGKKSTRFE